MRNEAAEAVGTRSDASTTSENGYSQNGTGHEIPSVLRKIEKWCSKTSVGKRLLPDLRIIPMKTPLSKQLLQSHVIDRGVACSECHTIPSLLSRLASNGDKLGLIVNLAAHDAPLYAEDLPSNIQVARYPMAPKVVPDFSVVDSAVHTISSFLQQNPGHCVAVHCDYGCNRTGLVLACYLIESTGMSVPDALAAVEEARGYPIHRDNFCCALTERYCHPSPAERAAVAAKASSDAASAPSTATQVGDSSVHAPSNGITMPDQCPDGAHASDA